MSILVGVVEDNAVLRMGMEQALGEDPAMELAFATGTAEEALRLDAWGSLSLAVIDLDLPGMSGTELISRVHREHPDLPLMVFTTLAEQESVFNALKAGARGYILKGDGLEDMLLALRRAALGQSSLSPTIAGWVIDDLRRNSTTVEAPDRLSEREHSVLQLLAQGKLYKEIADQLSISVHTAHAHIRKIYSKFQASGRKETLRKARLLGHLPPEGEL